MFYLFRNCVRPTPAPRPHRVGLRCQRASWQLAQSPDWDSKHPCVAPVWTPNTCVSPRLGIQKPVCSPGWDSKHLYVAPIADPNAWAYSKPVCSPGWGSQHLSVPKHLCVAPFQVPWSLKAIVHVATSATTCRIKAAKRWTDFQAKPSHVKPSMIYCCGLSHCLNHISYGKGHDRPAMIMDKPLPPL